MQEPTPPSFFTRTIFRIYHRNAHTSHFLKLRFLPAGVLLTLLVPASWMLIPQHSIAPLFHIRALLIGIPVVACLWALSRRAKLSCQRQLPRQATAQQPLPYKVRVRNLGKRPLSAASLLEMPPDNRPNLPLFDRSREPGEQERNIFDRTFCYYRWEWLQESLSLFKPSRSDTIQTIQPGESAMVTLILTPQRRGVIALRDLRVCLPDPFGAFQRCQRTANPQDQLIVLPHRYQLPPENLPGAAQFQLGGEASSGTIGQSGDFTCTREYRPGDPLRHIHWKSWARTGKAIVKEYEDLYFPRYGLVLDTFAPAEDADLFEEAVSVAASYAASIDTRESLLDLMFIRDEAFTFTAGRGEERIDAMLEVLAGVSCDPQPDFRSLQQLVLRYRDELSACICIFTGWSEAHRDTIRRLHRAGLSLRLIVICRDRAEAEDQHLKFPSPVAVQWLRVDQIQADLMH